MQHVPVQSTNLTSIAYDAGSATLEAEFKDGARWRYAPVSAELHASLMSAKSPGRFFGERIKGGRTITATQVGDGPGKTAPKRPSPARSAVAPLPAIPRSSAATMPSTPLAPLLPRPAPPIPGGRQIEEGRTDVITTTRRGCAPSSHSTLVPKGIVEAHCRAAGEAVAWRCIDEPGAYPGEPELAIVSHGLAVILGVDGR